MIIGPPPKFHGTWVILDRDIRDEKNAVGLVGRAVGSEPHHPSHTQLRRPRHVPRRHLESIGLNSRPCSTALPTPPRESNPRATHYQCDGVFVLANRSGDGSSTPSGALRVRHR